MIRDITLKEYFGAQSVRGHDTSFNSPHLLSFKLGDKIYLVTKQTNTYTCDTLEECECMVHTDDPNGSMIALNRKQKLDDI
jgi:hypothetical protein